MIGLIQVVIGLVFLLLLLSLLVTTIMELISSMLALRGQNLEKAIRNMLASGQEKGELFQGTNNSAIIGAMPNSAHPPTSVLKIFNLSSWTSS